MNPNCPSMEQLMGVVDMTDPCQYQGQTLQSPNSAFTGSGNTVNIPLLGNVSPWVLVLGIVVLAGMTHSGK